MKNIEKLLYNSVCGTGKKLTKKQICAYAEEDGDNLVNILFNFINTALDKYQGTENLDYLDQVFEYINIAIISDSNINIKKLSKRKSKLEEKIYRIIQERSRFKDETRVRKQLGKIENQLNKFQTLFEHRESKKYNFIKYFVYELKDIDYIEYILRKTPSLIFETDQNNETMYFNIIKEYMKQIEEDDEESILYYNNLLSLIHSSKNFQLSNKEKKEVLEEIYRRINKLSTNKKESKKNKEKITLISSLKEMIVDDKQKENIEQLATKYKIHIPFDEQLIDLVGLHQTAISKINYPQRVLVDDYIITIDGPNTQEIDDALSCKKLKNGNYLLGVHIASILGYFPYDSVLIDEAFERVHSIYLPKSRDKNDTFNSLIPIFPLEFSTKKASLIENQPKLARSYYFEIDNDGNVINQSFLKTIITSNKRTTYQEVDNILKKGTSDLNLQNTITNLKEVTEKLSQQYHAQSLYENVKESSLDFSDLRVKKVGSEKIVYQAMLLTGNKVAEFFANSKEGYPCLYRVHQIDEKTNQKIEDMLKTLADTYGSEQYDKLYKLLNGIYPKCWYDIKGEHTGLGLKHYCHCTSGLRRAPDIVVEHALDVCYDQNPTDLQLRQLEEDIKIRASQVNSKNKSIDWFVSDYNRTLVKRKE